MNKNKITMKKIFYYLVLSIILSCSKDSKSAIEIREIQFSYAETEINTTFRTAGSVAPVILDWDGEPGTYSISSSTGILQENVIAFDTLTGQFSWGKDFPVGTYDFTITANSGNATTSAEITLTNIFIKGFFSGGFAKADFDSEGNPNFVPLLAIDYGLQLNEDGSISMEKYSNPALTVSGSWAITKEGVLSVEFITNLSGGQATYMLGLLAFDSERKTPLFGGKYGASLDESQEIENPTGIFSFRWD